MRETWLQPNRRAIWFGCIPPLMIGTFGVWLAIQPSEAGRPWWRWIGVAMTIVAIVALGMLMRQLHRPRIAYRGGSVLFYLRSGPPVAVPVQVVEAFFLGQGPANLPGGIQRQEQTVNLIARLSQREIDWAHRAVKSAFGNWADGYVTVRGTWCEPLGPDVVRRLNRRLKEVKKNQPITDD
jgi:hypothetical protein